MLNLPVEPQPVIQNLDRYHEQRYRALVLRLQMCDEYHREHGLGPLGQKLRRVGELMSGRGGTAVSPNES